MTVSLGAALVAWQQGIDVWLIGGVLVASAVVAFKVAPYLAHSAPPSSPRVSRIMACLSGGSVAGFFIAGGVLLLSNVADSMVLMWFSLPWFRGPLTDSLTAGTAGGMWGSLLGAALGACQRLAPPAARSIFVLAKHQRWITAAAFAPNDRLLATASYDGSLRLWNVVSGEEVLAITTGLNSGVTALAFDPPGQRLASASGGKVQIWDVDNGRRLLEIDAHRGAAWGLTFSPDGARLTTVGDDAALKQWNAATGAEHWASTPAGDLRSATSCHVVACSPDGRLLATGGRDAIIRLWNAELGVGRQQLKGHVGGIEALAFSPDGRLLASGGDDQMVRIWQVEAGKLLLTLYGHQGSVRAVAFSPDGQTLATGSEDRTARLWRVGSGEGLARLVGHEAGVTSVSFSRQGSVLATGSGDSTVRVWALRI